MSRWQKLVRMMHGMRFRVTAAFLLAFALMSTLALMTLRQNMLSSFASMDRQASITDAKRVVSALDAQLDRLEYLAKDWAARDELHHFAAKPYQEFVRENLSSASLSNAGLSFVLIFNNERELVTSKLASSIASQATGLAALTAYTTPLLLQSPSQTNEHSCGVINAHNTLHMTCSVRISKGEFSGTPIGTLVIGRALDSKMLDVVANESDVPFVVTPIAPRPAKSQPVLLPGHTHFNGHQAHLTFRDDVYTIQYPIVDLLDREVAAIEVNLSGMWMQQGALLLGNTFYQLTLIAVFTCLALLAAVHFLCTMPIHRLHESLTAVINRRDWSTKLPVSGHGEVAFLTKEINGLMSVIDNQVNELNSLSMTDSLTGLANRRWFDVRLAEEIQRSTRHSSEFALLAIDIDYFKQFNDRYGHAAGDAALRQVAHAIHSVTRKDDLAARIGGEEFMIILSQCNDHDALCTARRLQETVRQLAIEHDKSPISRTLTICVGVAVSHGQNMPSTDLQEQADQALYSAKNQGRNRVVLFDSQPPIEHRTPSASSHPAKSH